jgi:hypothetical protein
MGHDSMPPKLVSLWDMLRPYCGFLGHALIMLRSYESVFDRDNERDLSNPVGELAAEYVGHLLDTVAQHGRLADLRSSATLAMHIKHELRPETKVGDATGLMREMVRRVHHELCEREFLYVRADLAKHYNEPLTAWGIVPKRFDCKEDIEEAERCFALERYTASVFHLMRVAELGLRAFAKKAKVRLAKGPLEWAEWSDLLRAVRAKAETIAQKQKRGPKKDAALEFYRGSLGEFEAFKDVYRNHVSHARATYDYHKAGSALQHVSEFMQRLAGGIDVKTL